MTKGHKGNSKENKKDNRGWKTTSKLNNAQGEEQELGNNVFDYRRLNNQNQYNRTLEAILAYIGRKYKLSADTIKSLRNLQKVIIPNLALPSYRDDSTGDAAAIQAAKTHNRIEDLKYVEKLKEHNKRMGTLDDNLSSAYNLIWGQCTKSMQAQLKTMNTYPTIRDTFEVVELLKEIKSRTFKLTDRYYPEQNLWASSVRFTIRCENFFLFSFTISKNK